MQPEKQDLKTFRLNMLHVLEDPAVRKRILKITKEEHADQKKTQDRIDRILDELKLDRERQEKKWEAFLRGDRKKWEENNRRWEENNRKWEENNRKWEENNRKWEEDNRKWKENQKIINQLLEEVKVLNRKYDAGIGALGARWGLHSEFAFRNGLKAILEDSFGVKVERYLDKDEKGVIFGRPDQVEIDVIVHNGLTILCEIKSSMSQSEIYTFWRKKQFYEKRRKCQVNRMMVISPMIDERAKQTALDLGIEIYGYAGDVPVYKD